MSERRAEVSPAADLSTLISWLWHVRLVIGCTVLVGAGVGLGLSYLAEPIYRADATISISVEERSGLFGGLGADLSSLASVAGLEVGAASDSREEATAFLRSRELGQVFLEKAEIKEVILAAPHLRFWPFDRRATDATHADRKAYQLFDRKVRVVDVDRKTGLVRVSMQWTDPEVAAQWANTYVELADAEYRRRYMARYQARIETLRERLASDRSVEMRNAVSRLLEGQMGLAIASDSRREFAFTMIDRAVPPLPSERQSPRRAIYTLLGILTAVTLVSVYGLLRGTHRLQQLRAPRRPDPRSTPE